MTIKRRLFLSNILMIVIPVFLSIALTSLMMYLTIGLMGLHKGEQTESSGLRFVEAVSQLQALSGQESAEELIALLEELYDDARSGELSLALYKGEALLASMGDYNISERPPSSSGGADVGLYIASAGEYTIYFAEAVDASSAQALPRFLQNRDRIMLVCLVVASLVIIIILLTNSVITRLLSRSIGNSLSVLSHGVQEIRDGNLEYRIIYTQQDEFAPVCADFNDMAKKLMDMVDQRQRDDSNRRELIAGISHDLRTPLTSVKAYLEGLMEGVASTPEARARYLQTLMEKTRDMEHIVNQLFLFARLDVGEFPLRLEPVNLGEELISYRESVREEYSGRGLRLTMDSMESRLWVDADIALLRSVFTNLLENSLKYGGHELTLSCHQVSKYASIVFSDNGPGVPDEDLARLFQAFYRSDKARSNTGKGSGLGLAISAKIIENMGGRIYAKNAPEGGLAITIRLPLRKGA